MPWSQIVGAGFLAGVLGGLLSWAFEWTGRQQIAVTVALSVLITAAAVA